MSLKVRRCISENTIVQRYYIPVRREQLEIRFVNTASYFKTNKTYARVGVER